MKRFLPALCLLMLFCSCNDTLSPKETAQKFIIALSSSDLSTAASLTSTNTKAVLDKAKKQTMQTSKPEESFQLSTLAETVAGAKAEVKNEVVAVPLVKEPDGWKVDLSEALLDEIQNHDQMLSAAKAKWEDMLKEYEARLQVLQDYVKYKKSLGSPSPNVQKLASAVNSISPQKEWTSAAVLAYAQKQKELDKLIDKALEPSLAANTDLSLNYFLQISNAGDRIKIAEAAFQSAAEKAHSPVYKPLPFVTTSSSKSDSN